MKFKILTILSIILLCSFPLLANAATYNWYFSDDAAGNAEGNDTTGDGSIGIPWKTLAKAQAQIDAVNSDDIVNLYFDRGDTWSMNTAAVVTTSTFGLTIGNDDPRVNINAYGTGAKPKFYGSVADFSAVPNHNVTTGPLKWSCIFQIERDYCSIKNIWIDGVYGRAVYTSAEGIADNLTIESCDITNIGSSVLYPSSARGTQNTTVTKNLIHTVGELCRFGKTSEYCGPFAVTFAPWYNWARSASGNIFSYNVMYDIYGEGVHGYGYIAEYNIIGDTASVGIYVCPSQGNATDTIIRYNLVVASSNPIYKSNPVSSNSGIAVADEVSGGDNSAATAEVYGNIVINRHYGILVTDYDKVVQEPWGSIKVYNNTVIDSEYTNYYINDYKSVVAGQGFFYNNSSILYDRTDKVHVSDQNDPADLSTYWTIDNNAFWTAGGSPTVDVDWRTNYVTTDLKLPGEPAVNWIGQTGATYFSNIDFDTHLYPPSDSGLVNAGRTLGSGYNTMFLTIGTDFNNLPDKPTFPRISQPDSGKWVIGAIIPAGDSASLGAIIPAGDSASIDPPASLGIKSMSLTE